jgi:hypothetical protein
MVISKKRVATFALGAALTIFGVSFGAFPDQALAWDNCPKGYVNDPYPGACRRYVDTNGDEICDLSQAEPVASTTTTAAPPSTNTQESTATADSAVVTTTSGEPPTGDCPLGPCAACGACLSIGSSVSSLTSADDEETALAAGTGSLAAVAAVSAATTTTTIPPSGGATGGSSSSASSVGGTQTDQTASSAGYNVSPLALGFFLIYAASFALYKTKRIKVTTHRKIWNVLLLGTFLITGVFGLILTIELDYTLPFTIPIDLLFWHVEAGVVMTLISLFHVGWHLNYYRNLVRRRRRGRVARGTETARPIYDEQLAREARERRWAEREAHRRRRTNPGLAPGPAPRLAPGPASNAVPAPAPGLATSPAQASGSAQIVRPYLPPRGRLEPKME